MKALSEYLEEDREVLRQAVSALGRWMERFYDKGIGAYDAWREMLLEERYFTGTSSEELLSWLLAQKEILHRLIADRSREAGYLLELAARLGKRDSRQPGIFRRSAPTRRRSAMRSGNGRIWMPCCGI